MIQNRPAAYSVQVKIRMVGHIHHRILIGGCLVAYLYGIVARQFEGDFALQVAGISFFPIFRQIAKSNAAVGYTLCVPHHIVESLSAAVERIRLIIHEKIYAPSVDHKMSFSYPVSVPADRGAIVCAQRLFVRLDLVKTDNHIFQLAAFIRHQQTKQVGAIIGKSSLHSVRVFKYIIMG